MSIGDIREHKDEETASERYARLRAAGLPTGWAAYCTSPSYCTRSCVDCRECARHEVAHHGETR